MKQPVKIDALISCQILPQITSFVTYTGWKKKNIPG